MLDSLRRRAVFVASIVLLVQAGFYFSVSHTEVIPNTPPWSSFPREIDGWRVISESHIDPDIVSRLQPDDYINRMYVPNPGSNVAVNLFVAYFQTQRKGLAPHSPQACLPGAGWNPVSAEVVTMPVSLDPGAIPVNQFLVEKHGSGLVVLYWYQQGKRSFANEQKAQLYAVPEMLLHGRTDIAMVRIIVPVGQTGKEEALRVAYDFAKLIYPLVRSHIPESI
jgi:EpsI family protein